MLSTKTKSFTRGTWSQYLCFPLSSFARFFSFSLYYQPKTTASQFISIHVLSLEFFINSVSHQKNRNYITSLNRGNQIDLCHLLLLLYTTHQDKVKLSIFRLCCCSSLVDWRLMVERWWPWNSSLAESSREKQSFICPPPASSFPPHPKPRRHTELSRPSSCAWPSPAGEQDDE